MITGFMTHQTVGVVLNESGNTILFFPVRLHFATSGLSSLSPSCPKRCRKTHLRGRKLVSVAERSLYLKHIHVTDAVARRPRSDFLPL